MALFGKKAEEKKEVAKKSPAKKAAPKKAPAKAAAKTAAKKASPKFELNRANVIRRPRITEKAAFLTGNKVYVFEVAMDANKVQIKEDIRAIYKVTPKKVRIVRVAPRENISRFRGRRGQSRGYKKAYVYLDPKDTIEYV
jgi:ribosomal protein L23